MSSIPSTQLTPHIDKMYMLGYINKAERQSPHAYHTLRDIAITVTAVAFASILAYPLALAAVANTALTFTAAYLIALPALSVALTVILSAVNKSKHWFDIRAAALVLEPKEKVLNFSFFQQFFPYHYKHTEEAVATPPPVKSGEVNKPAPQTDAKAPQQIGVIVGCNYPIVQGGKYKLSNCQNDAKHIKELLLNTGSTASDITLMLDVPENQGKEIYPSRQNILRQIEKSIDKVNEAVLHNPSSVFYFHESGHGLRTVEKIKGTEPDGQSDAMVAADFEFIVDSDLKALVKAKLHPNASAIFTLDCCHSGTMLDLQNNYVFSNEKIISTEVKDELDFGSVVLISGCEDKQTSADGGSIHGQGAGAMTAAYYSTLEEHNYNLTWRQLLIGINDKIKAVGLQQNPQLSSSRKLNLDSYAVTSEIRFRPQIA